MRKLIGGIGVAVIVMTLIAAFVAYFVQSVDPRTQIMYDGFGRRLSEMPWLLRTVSVLARDPHVGWAGWLWSIGDVVIFGVGMGVGANLSAWGFKERKRPPLDGSGPRPDTVA
jgi:hypothetical protein